jgi:hypothetical protein
VALQIQYKPKSSVYSTSRLAKAEVEKVPSVKEAEWSETQDIPRV